MKNIYLLIVMILIIGLVPSKAQFDSRINTSVEYVPGTMNGTFSTSSSGAAVYSIPLDLPEGRVGMTPQLGLIYNSHQGGSLLGKGWGLAGLSSISRTNPSTYYNGQPDNIDFEDDQLIMDGQNLIQVSQDIYRPENDPSIKIELLTGLFGKYFMVSFGSGLVKEYGNSEDSRQVYSTGGTEQDPLIWHINKVIDRAGNTIKYEYLKNVNQGEIYPHKIYYTGYEIDSREISQGFYCVEFIYETLDTSFWQTFYYQKDNELYRNVSSKLLKGTSITYQNESQWFKYYEFIYDILGTNVQNAPFLKEILNKSVNDGIIYTMKGAEFAWEFYRAGFIPLNHNENDIIKDMVYPPMQKMCKLNLSGTSVEDVAISKLIRKDEEWKPIISVFYWGLTYELQIEVSFNDLNAIAEPFAIDIDMNGDDELVFIDDEGIKVYDFTLNAEKKWIGTQTLYPEYIGKLRIGDINGDGISDILITTGSSTGHIFFGTANYENPFIIEAISLPFLNLHNFVALLDFNGDGKSDVLWRNGQDFDYKIYSFSENHQFIEISQLFHSVSNTNIIPFYEDLNGDGKTDFCFFNKVGNKKSVYFSFGEGFTSENQVTVALIPHLVSDLNNDGLADFTEFDWAGEKMKSAFGMPDGINMSEINAISLEFTQPMNGIYDQIMADIDGNGIQDVVVEFFRYVEFQDESILGRDLKNEDNISAILGQELHLYSFEDIEDGIDAIHSFKNGWGAELKVEYNPYNCAYLNSEMYSDYPLTKYRGIKQVVRKSYINNEEDDFNLTEYAFSMPVMHLEGKGFLGFQKVKVKDLQNGQLRITNHSIFSQDGRFYFPYPDIVEIKSLHAASPSDLISKTRNAFSVKVFAETSPPVYKPVATESHTQTWDNDENHSFISTSVNFISVNDFDNHGNLQKTISCTDEEMIELGGSPEDYAFQTITQSQYLIDEENWILSRPANYETINKFENDPVDDQIFVAFTYYQPGEINGNGIEPWPKLKYEISTPNRDPEFSIANSFEYDRYGHVSKTETQAPHSPKPLPVVMKIFEYNETYQGRFLTLQTEGSPEQPFISYYHYEDMTGLLKSEMNPQGLQTGFDYDTFGRLIEVTPPNSIKSRTSIEWSEGEEDNPPDAIYMVKSYKILHVPVHTESEVVKTYFTKYGQDVRTVTRGLNGRTIYVDKKYDTDGRLKEISEPYFAGISPTPSIIYNYDSHGRIVRTDLPAKSIKLDYLGRFITTTDLSMQISVTRQVDALGRNKFITDPSGTISYEYYSSGKIRNINALGSITELVYDAAGNQTSLVDPDAGRIDYTYNAYGQLICQTDANQKTFNLIYDDLNRLKEKRLDGGGTMAAYSYFDEPFKPSYGMPSNISGNNITYDYFYDNLGRIEIAREEVDGIQRELRYGYYLHNGKLMEITYPSGFKIAIGIDDYSGEQKFINCKEWGQTLWQVHSTNARGQLLDYSLGNGLWTSRYWDEYGFPTGISTVNYSSKINPPLLSRETDDIPEVVQSLNYNFNPLTGNLESRSANNQAVGISETFSYDNLLKSRLTAWIVNGQQVYSARYEGNGNIITKSGITQEEHSRYLYAANAGPHAVMGIDIPSPDYLAHCTPQDITYTAFNKVQQITQNFGQQTKNPGDEIWNLDIVYGPDEQRKKSVLSCNHNTVKTKYFTGNFYEEEHYGTTVRKLHYLYASDGLFAIYVMNGENDTMYYVHKDYLGSYDVITDEQGHIMERYSFDPWGRRRNPADWTYTSVPAPHLFDRGYTGHEHLDKFGLINMNGRVYDPWLSRFLSPDPFVQTTTHSQSYNRYSYCLNNPLKYTDPSGYKQKPFFEWEANATYYYGGSGFSGRIGPGSGSYWSDHFGNSVSGIGSYSYDWETGNYYNNLGRQVSFNEVYRNYIQPNQVNSTSADQILVTIEFERYTPKLTKRYTPGLSEWTMDDGSIWYAYGYDIITTKKVFEVASGGGGGNDLLEAVGASAYWAGTINTLYGINEEKNLAENLSRAKGYKQVTGRVPKSLRTSVNYGKATTALTKGVSRSLFGVGIVLSSVDVYQDPSVSNIAWNSADVLMGAAAFIPGMQIPALIYFTARTAYEVYDAYKEP